MQNVRQSSKESTGSSDSESSSDDESTQTGATVPTAGVLPPEKVNHQKESEAGAEISALVNYVQPVHFTSFEASESKIKTFSFIVLTIMFKEHYKKKKSLSICKYCESFAVISFFL